MFYFGANPSEMVCNETGQKRQIPVRGEQKSNLGPTWNSDMAISADVLGCELISVIFFREVAINQIQRGWKRDFTPMVCLAANRVCA